MIPILFLTPAWLLGIGLETWLGLDSLWLWLLVGIGGGLALGLRVYRREATRYNLSPLIGLGLVAVGLGGLRLLLGQPSSGPDELPYYLGQTNLRIVGVVSGEPTYTDRLDSFRLSAEQVWPEGATEPVAIRGEVYVGVGTGYPVERGDRLELTGRLAAPKEVTGTGFPYRDWLARQGIYATISYPRLRRLATHQGSPVLNWFYDLNQSTRQNLTRYVPDEEGVVLGSILIGDTHGLERDTRLEFTTAGVTHILVVSGSNISIMVALLALVCRPWLSRNKILVITLVFVMFYVLLVGFSPTILRAGLMAYLAIFGRLLGREYSGLLGLAGSALLMTLWQPQVLLDISFQLSFMATLGIILLARLWQDKLGNWWSLFKEALVMTLAAELMTAPLIAYYFHQFSAVSVITNVLVEPIIPLLTLLAVLVLGLGLLPVIGPLLGAVVGGLTWLGVAYLLAMIKLWAEIETSLFGNSHIDNFHVIWVFVYYAIVGAVGWWWRVGRKSQTARQWVVEITSQAGLIGAGVVTGTVWLIALLV